MPRNDSRSPPPRRGRDRSRSRSRGRGGSGGGGRGGRGGDPSDWGTSGKIAGLRNGFGFIRPDAGQVDGKDLYFHAKECKCSFDELQQDDEVTYVADYDDRTGKHMATKVESKGGGGGGRSRRRDSRGRDDSRRRGRR